MMTIWHDVHLTKVADEPILDQQKVGRAMTIENRTQRSHHHPDVPP
jgi:hypothetical protein